MRCPMCDVEATYLWMEREDGGINYHVYKCPECGKNYRVRRSIKVLF